MAVAITRKNALPWASRLDETGLDIAGGVTDLAGQVHARVVLDLVGTMTQVKADIATVQAATMTSTSALLDFTGA